MTKKRRRPIHLHVMVSEEEQALIQQRMAESGIRNMGAYMRKMALNGYVLHVDLSPVRELVSLQRRCSNNLNSGGPGQHLRRDLPRGDRRFATGLCRPVGAAVRFAEKALRIGGALILPGSGVCRSPVFTTSGQFVPRC